MRWAEHHHTMVWGCPVVLLAVFVDLPPDVDAFSSYRGVTGRGADRRGNRQSWELQWVICIQTRNSENKRTMCHSSGALEVALYCHCGVLWVTVVLLWKRERDQFYLTKSYREVLHPSDNNRGKRKDWVFFAAWAVCDCSSLLPLPIVGSIRVST